MTDTILPRHAGATARGRAVGALVMGGFGALWSGLGVAGLGAAGGGPLAWTVVVVALLIVVAQAVRLWRAHPKSADTPLDAAGEERERRRGKLFTWVSAGEGLAILVAVNVVANLGHPEWRNAAVMLVVGLHFFPLAAAFGYRRYVVLGAALTAWTLAFPWLLSGGASDPRGLLGAGLMLFLAAAAALRDGARASSSGQA